MRLLVLFISFFIQFQTSAQNYLGDFSHKEEDHYWTKSGEKVFGQFEVLYKNAVNKTASIKVYRKGGLDEFVEIDKIESLIIGSDSFIVASDYILDGAVIYSKDLVRVMQVGKINLYQHCRAVPDMSYLSFGMPSSYYKYMYVVQKSGDSTFYRIASRGQFKTHFLSMVADNEKLVAKILATKKKWWISDIPDLVEEYNKTN